MSKSGYSKICFTLALTFVAGTWGCSSDKSSSSTDGGAKDGSVDGAKDGAADVSGTLDANADVSRAGDTASGDATTADAPGPDTLTALQMMQMRGQYLVDHVIACPDCHTPIDETTHQPIRSKYMAGGLRFIPDKTDPRKYLLA